MNNIRQVYIMENIRHRHGTWVGGYWGFFPHAGYFFFSLGKTDKIRMVGG
jgi:hypothetical protein